MRDKASCTRSRHSSTVEAHCCGIITAIVLTACMAGGGYTPLAGADEPLSISTSPSKPFGTTLTLREIRPNTPFVEPASAEVWVSSDDAARRPDATTGTVLKTTIGKAIPVDTPREKSLRGFNAPFPSSAEAQKRIVLSLGEPAPARKPVVGKETGKMEAAEQPTQPPAAKLSLTVPKSQPAALPRREETTSSVAKTDLEKLAWKPGTSSSIVGARESKSLLLERNRQASRLNPSEPTSRTAPENKVVRLKPAPMVDPAPAVGAKDELKKRPIPAQRRPVVAAAGGPARREATTRTRPFSSGNPFATSKSRKPLFVFEPVSPQWIAKATTQAAGNGRRKPTMPEKTATPAKLDRPAPKAASESIAARQGTKPRTAVRLTVPEQAFDLTISEKAPLESRVASRQRIAEDPVVEMVDFRNVPSPDGRASTMGMTTASDLARSAVLEAEDRTPLLPLETQVVQNQDTPIAASPVADEQVRLGQFEVIDHSEELTVVYRRSKLLRTNVDVYRTAVVDASICEVVQYTPREISVIGNGQGATHVTFWFEDGSFRPVTYLVRVVPDPEVQERQEEQYGLLEEHLAELFPESKVQLLVLADKLIVRGQARSAEEASQILAVIRGQAVRGRDLLSGTAASLVNRDETNRTVAPIQVINMLQIPGVQQVALRVKIAELSRSAARGIGVDLDLNFSQGELLVQSLINAATGGTASILGSFDGGDLEFGLHYLEEHGVIRMLSEPTLVTLSGRPATFIAGGEFAVPTTVGVGGAAAVTTDFRAYGAIISFLPVILDKDHIRLEVAPEFSKINDDNTVNGTPGLDTRAVTTTVEMREGQTLAIAGLLDESMDAEREGDLPWISQIFGRRSVTRNETELIILVTPELIHPMEPEAVPPLPGFDVTEPTNCEFFLKGHLEGRPTQEYRSTVWPRLRRRYQAGGPAMISGPFGHGD